MGEEDEVSIKEAADAIVEAMDFKGELIVSFRANGGTPNPTRDCGVAAEPPQNTDTRAKPCPAHPQLGWRGAQSAT